MALSPLKFIIQATLAGLAAAAVLLWLFPELLGAGAGQPGRPVAQTTPTPSRNPGGRGSGPVSYSKAVARAAPAVVNIFVDKREPGDSLESDSFFRRYFGDTRTDQQNAADSNLGSAVILSAEGYLLTNNHLVRNAVQIQVLLQDGRVSLAQVVGTDPETDLAVLKIDLPDLPTVSLGFDERLRVGDVVLAIGNPFGVGQTVTLGIVSATGRNQIGTSPFGEFIQTDAAINPGNSGGALIDARGRLVGINTAIFSGGSEGIGFAIPVSTAQRVMSSIIELGYVPRGWLGAAVLPVTAPIGAPTGLRQAGGVVINHIVDGSPASASGLRRGDVITHINGRPVATQRAAINAVANSHPGSTIAIAFVRDGEMQSVEATVMERNRTASQQLQPGQSQPGQ